MSRDRALSYLASIGFAVRFPVVFIFLRGSGLVFSSFANIVSNLSFSTLISTPTP